MNPSVRIKPLCIIPLLLIAVPSLAATPNSRHAFDQQDRQLAAAKRSETTRSLEPLRDRSKYAGLYKSAVEALAQEAAAHWPQEFSGFNYLRVERFSAGGTSHWISIWLHDKSGLEFALIPGGKFQMGSPIKEDNRKEHESQHWVTLDPFLIARTECTRKSWSEIANSAEHQLAQPVNEGSELRPVQSVTLEDVKLWCLATGLALPTEAQWEFACRAGTTSTWTMGADQNELKFFANLGSADCPDYWFEFDIKIAEEWHDGFGDEVAPVGSFKPNSFGLFDVHGNVREWCRDKFVGYEVNVEPGTGLRPGTSEYNVARGGSFNGAAFVSRSAQRDFNHGQIHRHFGFRPSLDLPFPAAQETD